MKIKGHIQVDGTIDATGSRIVNVGAPTTDTDAARRQDIGAAGPGFYGINVGETDGDPIFSGIGTIKFNSDSFYVTQQDTDTAIVNFRGDDTTASNLAGDEGIFAQQVGDDLQFKSLTAGTDISLSSDGNAITINSTASAGGGGGFYGIVVKDDVTAVVTDSIEFQGSDFDVSASGDGALVVLDATVAHLSDLPPAFYGVIVQESDGSNTQVPDDTIQFAVADFVVSDNSGKPLVTLESNVARTADIGPGFYGITAKNDDDITSFSGLEVFSFETEFFYLTQNPGNTDEVQVNLRNLPGAGGGEVNDGVSLGGDEDIFTTKSGLNLQFKGLTAGTDISLSSDANAITINSTASGGGGGGFYGVIFKESGPGTFVEHDQYHPACEL
ncbi:MAG: hypothetical protein ACXABY_22510 [Candidatus Thorarchaeota archaeon]|jgi:hypothetical protein